MPGVDKQESLARTVRAGHRTALRVCHAMIIAITVVLPAPVAIFSASRTSSGLASALAAVIRPP